MGKVYCFVDETGQDTKGKLFSVCCTVVVSFESKEELEELMLEIEKETRKKSKWQRTDYKVMLLFLDALLKYKKRLRNCIFIQHFYNIDNYVQATVEAISRSIKKSENQDKSAVIYIDGLSKKSVNEMSARIRGQGIKTEKVKGLKDEQSSLIRLSDAVAGFVRDYLEGQDYAKEYYLELLKSEVISEI